MACVLSEGSSPSVPIGFLILYFLLFGSACREMGAFLIPKTDESEVIGHGQSAGSKN